VLFFLKPSVNLACKLLGMKQRYFSSKVFFALFSLLIFSKDGKSQVVFWTEDFNNSCAANCPGVGYTSGNGTWTQTITGVEGADPNLWYVSCAENGHTNTICGTGCVAASATATLASLHIGSNPNSLGDIGAAYDAGGLCGIFTCPQTDRRIESPTINCTGRNSITLAFNYIEAGDPPNDDADIWYFDGAVWSLLTNTAATNNAGCGGQGRWTSFTIALPSSANNNPNVKIGFHWINNDDGVGTDPSFAVDDVTLSEPSSGAPVAAFTMSTDTICIGQSVNFTDNSTGGPTSWSWTFPSGTPATSVLQNVAGVVWNMAGTYTVTFTATNGSGSSTTTQTVTVMPIPVLTATASSTLICVGQSSTLTSTGASAYLWQPGNLLGASVSVTPLVTTTYTVIGTNAGGCTGTATVTVNVVTCSVPIVGFSANDTTLCVGDCINFIDNSSGNPTSWSWVFAGAVTGTSTSQNPTGICYNAPGTFAVTLTATNVNGSSSLTRTTYIVVSAFPTAGAGPDATICAGQQTTLLGTGGGTYQWSTGGTTASIVVTPATTTTYTVTVSNSAGCTSTDQVTITVQPCAQPVAALTISDNAICESTCIDFTDVSTGSPTGWSWTFTGGVPATSTAQNPTSICYNTPGTYDVTLIVTNAFGSDTIVMIGAVTVTATPVADAGPYVIIAIGNNTQLNATGGVGTYTWTPPTGLDNPNIANPLASPTVTTTYTVNYTDAQGCSSSDTVTVEVIEEYSLFIPSAFSPNGDQANDVLFVRGAGIKSVEFVVFDRNGEIVFESQSIHDGWDGTFRGQNMNSGIFVYYVKANFYNGTTKTLQGDVSLVR
jgi:gliding motility-associated-like protein